MKKAISRSMLYSLTKSSDYVRKSNATLISYLLQFKIYY